MKWHFCILLRRREKSIRSTSLVHFLHELVHLKILMHHFQCHNKRWCLTTERALTCRLKGASSFHLLERALHTLATFLFYYFHLLNDQIAPYPHLIITIKPGWKDKKIHWRKLYVLYIYIYIYTSKGNLFILLCF